MAGGIIALYKYELGKNIKEINNKSNNIMWMIYKKNEAQYLIAAVYNPPKYSEYENRQLFTELENEITWMQDRYSNAVLIIVGDFNARVAEVQEVEEADGSTKGNNLKFDIGLPKRKNQDKVINDYGKKMVELCKKLDLLVLNGRSQNEEKENILTLQKMEKVPLN